MRSESSEIESSFVVFLANLAITSTEIKQSEDFVLGISAGKKNLLLAPSHHFLNKFQHNVHKIEDENDIVAE